MEKSRWTPVNVKLLLPPRQSRGNSQLISIIGLDLAKQVFQVHAADERGRCVLRKQLKRCEVLAFFAKLAPCVVAMEACGTAHYWAREIAKTGHEVRLDPHMTMVANRLKLAPMRGHPREGGDPYNPLVSR